MTNCKLTPRNIATIFKKQYPNEYAQCVSNIENVPDDFDLIYHIADTICPNNFESRMLFFGSVLLLYRRTAANNLYCKQGTGKHIGIAINMNRANVSTFARKADAYLRYDKAFRVQCESIIENLKTTKA